MGDLSIHHKDWSPQTEVSHAGAGNTAFIDLLNSSNRTVLHQWFYVITWSNNNCLSPNSRLKLATTNHFLSQFVWQTLLKLQVSSPNTKLPQNILVSTTKDKQEGLRGKNPVAVWNRPVSFLPAALQKNSFPPLDYTATKHYILLGLISNHITNISD